MPGSMATPSEILRLSTGRPVRQKLSPSRETIAVLIEGCAMPGVRLEWDGKGADVSRLKLPLQVVETINAARADRGTLSSTGTRTTGGATN